MAIVQFFWSELPYKTKGAPQRRDSSDDSPHCVSFTPRLELRC